MEKKYSVEEILDAINDLNNFKKNSIPKKTYNTTLCESIHSKIHVVIKVFYSTILIQPS